MEIDWRLVVHCLVLVLTFGLFMMNYGSLNPKSSFNEKRAMEYHL